MTDQPDWLNLRSGIVVGFSGPYAQDGRYVRVGELPSEGGSDTCRAITGVMVEADFQADTITLQMDHGYYAAAGQYMLVRINPAPSETSHDE